MEATMIGAYIGMFMVLAAFAAETRNVMSSRSLTYLLLMAIGEALLTLRAYVTGEWPSQYWAVFGHFLLPTQ